MNQYKIEEDILSAHGVQKIYCICKYGAEVYGTNTCKSDKDRIVILESDAKEKKVDTFDFGIYSFQIYTFNEYTNAIKECEPWALEVLFYRVSVRTIDKKQMRRKFSQIASNSWVKAKKKITLPNEDSYIGLKSLFHSLRLLDFAYQIATKDSIYKFDSCNDLYKKIMEIGPNWEELKAEFQPVKNAFASQLRKAVPWDDENET